jgi:putative MATE family efflux protein
VPSDKIELLGSGDVRHSLISLSVPAISAMLVGALYNVIDTMFIGLLDDTPSIGAATIVFPLFMLISAIGLAFGMGAASPISRYLGSGEQKRASETASTAFFATLATGVGFTAICLIFIDTILLGFGATPEILDRSHLYGSIIIGGCIFRIINMCLNNLLRAEGASRYSGIAMIIGTGGNIILDPIYMFVFGWGLAGAALATITAQLISTIFLLTYYLRGRSVLMLSVKHIRLRWEIFREILKIGIPTFIRQILASTAMGMMNIAAKPFGNAAIAAVGIDMRMILLVMFVFFGLGQGFQPFAGYNYGAQNMQRVRSSFALATRWSIGFGTIMMFGFLLAADSIVLAFSRDPQVVRIAADGLRAASLSLWFVGFQNLGSVLFQALGKGWESIFLALARQGLLYIPLLFILPRWFGIIGIMISQPIADLLTTLVTMVLLYRQQKTLEVIDAGCH